MHPTEEDVDQADTMNATNVNQSIAINELPGATSSKREAWQKYQEPMMSNMQNISAKTSMQLEQAKEHSQVEPTRA